MQETSKYIRDSLSVIYTSGEAESIASQLLSEVTGFSRTELILNKNTKISDSQKKLVEIFVNELLSNKPLQYVLGRAEFYGLLFKVNNNVLIPRPETEELVEWILSTRKNDPKLHSVLDIGTGSGCIPVSIKKMMPVADVWACDISRAALEVAAENAVRNKVDVHFFQCDILNAGDVQQKWDVIVSNPPYIPQSDKNQMHANVLDYEPHIALFVADDDPLRFYRAIAAFAQEYLTDGGFLFFEIHRDFGNETVALLNNCGFTDIELRKDMSGNDRMIKARKL